MGVSEIMQAALLGVAALSTVVEVSKIKINPWSSLFKWIGNKMMEDTKKEIDEIKKEQEAMAKRQNELAKESRDNSADTIKSEVFRFYNECQRGYHHTEAEFNHIITLNKKYEHIVEKDNMKNGVYKAEYEYILKLFKRCQDQGDFSL